jgi:hypothetical protein
MRAGQLAGMLKIYNYEVSQTIRKPCHAKILRFFLIARLPRRKRLYRNRTTAGRDESS